MKKLRRKSGSFPIIDIYFNAKLGTLNWIKEGETSLGIKINFREKRNKKNSRDTKELSYGGLQGKKINHGYCKTFL